jgi:hypothetical protein
MFIRPNTLCLLLAALSVGTLAQTIDRQFLQVALRAETGIVIDGKLDEAVWAAAPGVDMAVKRHPEASRTVTKLVWDDTGIYVGVICYSTHLDTLIAQVVSRDGGAVWADDSCELFISPRLSAINYYKFDVNSRGVFGDNYKEDAALHHWDWNAMDAKCASGRLPGAWTLELFVSWKDMQFHPKEGQFIGFQQTRFEWNGAELRASYLTGGSYFQVLLAFVYLSGPTSPGGLELAQRLDRLIRNPWFVASDDRLWFFSDKKDLLAEAPDKLIGMMADKASVAFNALEASFNSGTPEAMKKSLAVLREAAARQSAEPDSVKRLAAYSGLLGKAGKLAAELELDAMLDEQ